MVLSSLILLTMYQLVIILFPKIRVSKCIIRSFDLGKFPIHGITRGIRMILLGQIGEIFTNLL